MPLDSKTQSFTIVGTRPVRALVLYGIFGTIALVAGAGLFFYSARRS